MIKYLEIDFTPILQPGYSYIFHRVLNDGTIESAKVGIKDVRILIEITESTNELNKLIQSYIYHNPEWLIRNLKFK